MWTFCTFFQLGSVARLAIAAETPPRADAAHDFALRDGDTLVFLGDSITAARTYTKFVENYTILRFPTRKVRFFNAGIGGDTAHDSLARLERDVFSRRATVLTVCFGLNDIGWGLRADDEHKRRYLDALQTIIAECRKRQIRVFICSSPVTAEDPDQSETGYLQQMGDEALALATQSGASVIDVQRPMREVQRRLKAINARISDPEKSVRLHAADGVHLNDLGHLAMAAAFLKGFHAPSEVSRARIDLQPAPAVIGSHCQIRDLMATPDGCEFTRLDEGLPINGGLFYALNFAYVPIHRDFNGYWLQITGLAEGNYEVTADHRGIITCTASQLAAGIDIASRTTSAWAPGGPWDAQASLLKSLTDSRHDIDTARLLSRLYLVGSPLVDQLDHDSISAEERVIELQRLAARPRPYRFVVRRVMEESAQKPSGN